MLNFEDLGFFGTEDETKVIYVKLNENDDQFELLKEINGILIQAMIDH
jgi:2'-5' RNA ligase